MLNETHGPEARVTGKHFMNKLILAILLFSTTAFAETISIKDHGAAGDGTTLDSAAFQKAIDAAATNGGGTVSVPAGKYLCGTIVLKDNITLHLEDGAEIVGTTD